MKSVCVFIQPHGCNINKIRLMIIYGLLIVKMLLTLSDLEQLKII